jgi:CelD/BcsL family acetyltransferase involved in cellulose biosynthesis
MRVELTDDPAAFRTRDWSPLVQADPTGTFFHTPAYLKLWWEEFGQGPTILAFAEDGGDTVAACAFEVVDGELRFLGGFDVTDYMGPVGRAGLHRPVAGALVEAMLEVPWERADLRGMPDGSPWLPALEEAAAAADLEVEGRNDDVAPEIHLGGSFAAYEDALPAKLRHEMRRKERRLVEVGGSNRVTRSTPETLSEDLDRFFELHRSSPGPKGRFMHPGMEIFFRRLGEAFLPLRRFQLSFVEVDGKKAAGAIGLAYGSTFSLYNSAFDRALRGLSPGMVLVARLIREAADGGCERFDLLKGDLAYKYRFGAAPRPVARLLLRR